MMRPNGVAVPKAAVNSAACAANCGVRSSTGNGGSWSLRCRSSGPTARVDVERSELVQAENVNVVELQRHVVAEFLREADIPLLRVWRLEVRVEHPAARAWQRVRERARDDGGGESMREIVVQSFVKLA